MKLAEIQTLHIKCFTVTFSESRAVEYNTPT